MRVFRIIEDLNAEPEIKEGIEPGIVKEDVEQNDEDTATTGEEQKDNTGD